MRAAMFFREIEQSVGVGKFAGARGADAVAVAGTPRASAISGVILARGRSPPMPALAPWLSLISMALIWGCLATVSSSCSMLKWPSASRLAKYPVRPGE